ncbi:MAG: glycosyltransferase family 4 protein [Acidobacteriota bacterium]
MMKIGVDATCWSNRRGFGRLARELLSALLRRDRVNHYSFLVDQQSYAECRFPEAVRPIIVPTRQAPGQAASATSRRSLGDLFRMSRAATGFDLFFFPAVYGYFPLLPRQKSVVMFHDAIADRHPEWIFPKRRLRFFWDSKVWLARHQASLILTVSEFARDSLLSQWKLAPKRVRVIREAASPVFRRLDPAEVDLEVLERWGMDASTPYLIHVGGFSPHKNLPWLVDVFADLTRQTRFAKLRLLLVGDFTGDSFHSNYQQIVGRIEVHRLSNRVILTGYLEDEVLVQLYNGARALVFPSREEGFGLPAVEAMACAIPVVASRAGSLPEVIGEAGLLFNPSRPADLKRALESVLDHADLRADLSARALKRSRSFSWERAAQSLLEMFEDVGQA